MPSKTPTQKAGLDQAESTTRVLLALWSLGGAETEVKRGDLTSRVVRKGQKSGDYQGILSQLEEDKAIAIVASKFSLAPKGIEKLAEGLKSSDFKFSGSIVGAWAANALLEWIGQMDGAVRVPTTSTQNGKSAIASYEEFKPMALEVYDRLNRDYNMGNLVPIYRIRREIGDRVSRSQFNEWLFAMQSDDTLQLLEESVEDSAPNKIEDSVTTKLGKLRCYAKRLAS